MRARLSGLIVADLSLTSSYDDLAFEAVRVHHALMQRIGETKEGKTIQAYLIRRIFRNLLAAKRQYLKDNHV
nr:MAG TPA: hypothetical protein [Caudoviricetes sp.]